MIVRIVKLSFRQEEIAAFKEILEASKEKIREFPGNLYLEMLQDENHPHIFFTYSHWENAEALENYRHSELFKSTWAKTKVLFSDRPEAWSTQRLHQMI